MVKNTMGLMQEHFLFLNASYSIQQKWIYLCAIFTVVSPLNNYYSYNDCLKDFFKNTGLKAETTKVNTPVITDIQARKHVITETKLSTPLTSNQPNCTDMVRKWVVNTRIFSVWDLQGVSIYIMAPHGKELLEELKKSKCQTSQSVKQIQQDQWSK